MSTRITAGGVVIAEVTTDAAFVRCTAVLIDGLRQRVCGVLIQRSADGDLTAGVVAHYTTCHPERKVR